MSAILGQLLHVKVKAMPQSCQSRILGEMMRITSPERTRFMPTFGHWTDGSEVILQKIDLMTILASIGPVGVFGLRQLLSFRLHLIIEDVFFKVQTLNTGKAHQ